MRVLVNRSIKMLFIRIALCIAVVVLISAMPIALGMENMTNVSLAAMPLCALLAGAAVLYVCYRYFRQQDRLMEDAVEQIREFVSGDRDARIACDEEGELYRLFHEINSLAAILNAQAKQEGQSKEFLKDTISDISHQLKTPLAALEMYMEILAEEPGEEETVKNFSEKSLRSLERMEQLILSLLKMARLDAGMIVFEKRMCFVADVAEQAVGELLERGNREGKKILVEGNQEETFFCDKEWTKEALGNLVKNALDHTKKGDVIRVSWKSSPVMLRLWVEDNGCGILPEDIHHIFKRFYRSKKSSDILGAGLGLSLAKGIVEGQGGILSVESVPGEGTVFGISLTKL